MIIRAYSRNIISVSMIVYPYLTSCSESKKDEGRVYKNCGSEFGDDFILSENNDENRHILKHLNTDDTRFVSYELTNGSGLTWKVEDEKVFLGERSPFHLAYEELAHRWSVKDDDDNKIGELTPYRTQACLSIQKMTLDLPNLGEQATLTLQYLRM